MPIYEFRCIECGHLFELLKLKKEDDMAMQCPKCQSPELERVLSRVSKARIAGSPSSVTSTSKSCGGGSCSSIEFPGSD